MLKSSPRASDFNNLMIPEREEEYDRQVTGHKMDQTIENTNESQHKLTPHGQDLGILSAGDNFSMQIKSVRPPDSADTNAITRGKPYQSDFGTNKKMMHTQ